MRAGKIAVIAGMIVMAALVLGCAEPDSTSIAAPTPTDYPSNVTDDEPGPSRLFDMDGISWYQYAVQQQTKDTVEYQKHVVEYANETYRTGVPVKHTSISRFWLHKDLVSGFNIWESSTDSTPIDSSFGGWQNGTPFALAPGARGVSGLKMYDLSTRFNASTDTTLSTTGFEPVRYGDQVYNCTVYAMPGNNATYRIWHNESLPLPLRVVIDDTYPDDFPEGLWTYDLEDWGYSPDKYDYDRASQDGEKTGNHRGSSTLFDMRNVSRYRYIVALRVNDEPEQVKLDISYEYPGDKRSKYTQVNKTWLYEDNYIGFRLEEGQDNGTLLSGNVTGGVTYGQPCAGRELYLLLIEDYRKEDVSTRFDAGTDGTMKLAGYEAIRFKGDVYNCTVYEITAEDDTFRVWHNTSLALPPKIVATYEKPGKYFWHPGFGIVSGPITYELVDWD